MKTLLNFKEMRFIFSLAFIWIGLLSGYCRGISHEVMIKGGTRYINIEDVFTEDVYVFSSDDNALVEWKLYIYSDYGKNEKYLVVESDKPDSRFVVDTAPLNWWQGEQIRYENDDNVYYYAMLYIHDSTNQYKDSIDIKFNLLPSDIRILSIKYDCKYDFEKDWIDSKNSTLSMEFECKRIEKLRLGFMDERTYKESESGVFIPNPREEISFYSNGSLCRFEKNYKTWGLAFCMYAINNYGRVQSEVLFINDYIEDPYILQKYNEYHSAGVCDVESKLDISLDGKFLRLNELSELVVRLAIYDSTGKVVYTQSSGEDIDASILQKGYYILVVNTRENQVKSLKFKI